MKKTEPAPLSIISDGRPPLSINSGSATGGACIIKEISKLIQLLTLIYRIYKLVNLHSKHLATGSNPWLRLVLNSLEETGKIFRPIYLKVSPCKGGQRTQTSRHYLY